ncbi:hypothetical protein BDW22DRAFT_1334651 [Trametopsis cervina]|nr:hypothetical protein BDW22DRAFT_1334651 [Trametopsis cervina]
MFSTQSGSTFGGFGSTQPQQQQQQQQQGTGGGLFGGLGTTQNNSTGGTTSFGANPSSNTGGGLFGTPSSQSNSALGTSGQQQQPSGGLFGNTQQNQPSGSLFGNTQQNQPSGGLFGNTQQNQPSVGGGLFGNTTGQNTTGGGLFSNTAPAGNAGGGLFGSTTQSSTASGTGSTLGGSLFGGAQNNASSGATGGGLFGNNTNASTNSGPGLFGASTTTPAGGGGGLFGSTNTNTPGATSSGLFGGQGSQISQPSLFNQQKPAGSLFAQPTQQQQPTNSLFSQSTQQPQQVSSSLFNSTNPQQGNSLFGTLGTSTLGTSALGNSLFASPTSVIPTQQHADPQSQFSSLVQRIDSIKQAWDSSSPQCRFQHFFYNLVDPAQVHLYGRPPNATNDSLWEKALRENPDPTCLVPVLAVGLDDLQQRVDAQTSQAANHSERLKELKTRIEALSQRHDVANTSRLRRAAALQTQLTHRVLKLVQHLHLLIPALRSSSIRPEEEALRTALEDIDEDVRRPGGMSKIRGKLNEMWALLDAVRAARERSRSEGQVEWAVMDEDGLGHIAQILAEEQAGLAHVTKILQRALQDLAVIQGVQPKEEDHDMLAGSSIALRDSLVR